MRRALQLSDAYTNLRANITMPWDVDEWMDDEYISASPLGRLVSAFGNPETDNDSFLRISWLTMFTARRALPCWSLYCDDPTPLVALNALSHWLSTGEDIGQLSNFTSVVQPKYKNVLIADCRSADTKCVAVAVSDAIKFALSHLPINAIVSISHADMAIAQSPLGIKDDFRKWLIEIAIPSSFEKQELTLEQQNAYRTNS